ncbi:MAG: hypothetical protein ACIARR_01125 [Phycisphaerales bacterium JB059]
MLDLSPPMLISGLILSALGVLLFFRGRGNQEPSSVVAGIALAVLPLATHSLFLLWGLGALVMGGWAAARRMGQSTPIA